MPDLGSTAGVQILLQATEGDTWAPDDLVRMESLRTWVSALIEHETGATFYGDPAGVTAVPKVIEGVPNGGTFYLPIGLYSVTSILENPLTWNGSVWSNGTALTTSQYQLAGKARNGVYRTILGIDRTWGGRYVVTGVWEDQVSGVPDDITALANQLTAELYKKQKASPAGFTGPDGAVVPIRNAFKEPEAERTLAKHRVGVGVWF